MKKILIITHTQDNECISTVSEYITQLGGKPIRFNVDLYPVQCRLSSLYRNGAWEIYLDDEHNDRHTLHDVAGLWYRRSFNVGQGLNQVLEGEYLGSAHGEVRQTLFGMLEGLHCFHIGKFSHYRRLDSKEEQMKIATMLGMKVPETCITNSPEEARRFVAEHPRGAIVKMQSSFAIYRDGQEHVVFTNQISESDLDTIDSLQYCPMQFQEKIEKALELRITIVGKELYCFAVDSQQLEDAKVDWRREGLELLEQWKPYVLPEHIAQQLMQLMDVYQMNYGAIDIIVTPEGDYYFLEINAAGEYFWLDRLMNGAISEQIAKVLLGLAPRRYRPVEVPVGKELV